jgi:hypothetical protein
MNADKHGWKIKWAETVFLPLLCEVEERGGERRRVFIRNSPLLNPLPTRSSWGEEEV